MVTSILGGVFNLASTWYQSSQQKKAAKKQFKYGAGLAKQEYTYQSELQKSAFEETEKQREHELTKLKLQYSQQPFQYQAEKTPIKKEYFLYILGGLGLIVLLTLKRK